MHSSGVVIPGRCEKKENSFVAYPGISFVAVGVFGFYREKSLDGLFVRTGNRAGICMVSMLSEGVIGMGDGLIICLLGLYIGARKVLIVLTVAFFLSGLAAMVYIALKKGKTARLPLIPYIYVGYVLSVSNGFGCGEVI